MRRVNAYKGRPVGASTPEAVTIVIKVEFPASLLPDAAASRLLVARR